MTYYIKVRKCVADYLGITADRGCLRDGNYMIWQNDLRKLGPLSQLDTTIAMIGGVKLTSAQARAEQDGITCISLPQATDPRFVVEMPKTEDNNETLENQEEVSEPEQPADEPESEISEVDEEENVELSNVNDNEYSEPGEND